MQAQLIDVVWQAMLWVCGLMYLLVIAFFAHALWRRRRLRGERADDGREERSHRGLSISLLAWGVLIVVGLAGLFTVELVVDRGLARAAVEPAVRLQVNAQQWWWEIQYESSRPDQRLRTANEIHIPVNEPVEAMLQSRDVIHSFWVPRLHGKIDLIPDRTNTIRLQALATGRYRGQCAEFCGLQHAHMAFDVIVHPAGEYRAWLARQLAPARPPGNDLERRGQAVFLRSACSSCHAITGTPAFGALGPDLTHVGSRLTLAAGTLENSRENLLRWIANPQRFKPGTRMPVVALDDEDRRAVAAYLASLQ